MLVTHIRRTYCSDDGHPVETAGIVVVAAHCEIVPEIPVNRPWRSAGSREADLWVPHSSSTPDVPTGHQHDENGDHEGPYGRRTVVRAVGHYGKHAQADTPGGRLQPTCIAHPALACVPKTPQARGRQSKNVTSALYLAPTARSTETTAHVTTRPFTHT
ncbi:hypothetical protein GCM10022285_08880 [Streptomyces tunisiensis]|uniref:Uncharacterized protein n=1 Tax=Streptomyces tunisiensis TaxID=948699 RepID=A0ABP7XVD9_9ACTN